MKSCWYSLLKLFKAILRIISTTERNFSKVVTLLKSISVMGNFLEIFQEFNKNSFWYKKHLWGIVSQTYKWRRFVCGRGWVISSLLWLQQKFSFLRISKLTNRLSPVRSKVNQGVNQLNLLPSPISLIYLRGTKTNGGSCSRIDQCCLKVKLYNMMKWPSEGTETYFFTQYAMRLPL